MLIKATIQFIEYFRSSFEKFNFRSLFIEIEDRELPPALFYLDKKIYFQKEGESYKITSKKRQNFNRLQAKFSNSVNQKKNDENIKHNLDKYGIIPAWVLFQKLSFGELAMFYTNTQKKNKKLVCKKLKA
ncbi:Abi family protein [Staphylococcus pseudintermedius]|uniref:Abi family protein n=1 Tax=Staphylococcus pseudintermedius TaxID=283734 RepID=UPI002A4E2D8C|nr:Abi family protein [Staphylococcus pseudintermedius]WQJ45962.1 Abi family protein [Staphylococcus pseudintermedius]WQJ48321.1 Abi family protein [Staphylococcus pseudintermedius]